TGNEVASDWYTTLNRAPWTPPGWVFGAAWATIMVCFAVFMAYLWSAIDHKAFVLGLYVAQWLLNVSWNPSFFLFHQTLVALVDITLLTALMSYMLFRGWGAMRWKALLVAPYVIWLLIATSLNGYIVLAN
ncbi:MAG: TspO/MBR family protein, partial [Bacteroidota bacterium]